MFQAVVNIFKKIEIKNVWLGDKISILVSVFLKTLILLLPSPSCDFEFYFVFHIDSQFLQFIYSDFNVYLLLCLIFVAENFQSV